MNELMNLSPEEIMSQLPSSSLIEFQASAFNGATNRLSLRSQRDGKTDTVMHAGNQITSSMLVGHVMTITRVGFASVPTTDNSGNPVYLTNKDGELLADKAGNAIPKMSTFPVCHFKEAPGCWYNGGKLLFENVISWADECGEEVDDYGYPLNPNLPKINAELEAIGGIQAYFEWKDKKDGSGQRYVNIIFA